MKRVSLSLLLVVVGAACASLCTAGGCPEDALLCNGKALQRDPNNHCKFPECPDQSKGKNHDGTTKQHGMTFTFSTIRR